MAISSPVIPEPLEKLSLSQAVERALAEESELRSLELGGDCIGAQLGGLSFSKLVFKGCRLTECNMEGCDFVDVVFDNCDLSGCRLEDAYFRRVAFRSVKAVGARLPGAVMKEVSMSDCNFSYSLFPKAKLENVSLNAQLREASFAQCRLKGLEMKDCDLTRADFFQTSLKGVDLRSCTIDGIVLSDGLGELSGAVVDLYQAAALAAKLGLVIK